MKLIRVVVLPLCLVMGNQVLGDWAYDMTSDKCSYEARSLLAESTRKQVENSVGRAEASIDAPKPLGDLSCLAGLMQLPLGTFASTGNLGSMFNVTLQNLISPNGNVLNGYCAQAEREWRKATRSLGINTVGFKKFKLPSYFSSANSQRTALQESRESRSRDGLFASSTDGEGHYGSRNQQDPSSTQKTSSTLLIQQESPPDADQSIEGIWDTLYGKESEQ